MATDAIEAQNLSLQRLKQHVSRLQDILQMPPATGADLYTQLADLFDALETHMDNMSEDALTLDVIAWNYYKKGGVNQDLASRLKTRGRFVDRNPHREEILRSVA